MCTRGTGVAQDITVAMRWFILAGDQGDADSQYILALAHGIGFGVARDDTRQSGGADSPPTKLTPRRSATSRRCTRVAPGLRRTPPRQHGGAASRGTTASMAPAGGAHYVQQRKPPTTWPISAVVRTFFGPWRNPLQSS